jgi:GNAT superfamily N-acetyltransferase
VSDTVTEVSRVTGADLPDLLPLLRAYCDFYEVAPTDEALLALSRALIADPGREGVQLVARDEHGEAVGFATVYWSWDTLNATRIGIMHDLFVTPAARGSGIADMHRRVPARMPRTWCCTPLVADGAGQRPRAARVRARWRHARGMG